MDDRRQVVLVAAFLVGAAACAGVQRYARTIGMRTGEQVTVTLNQPHGLPSCTLPASNEVTCEFPEEFVQGLSAASESEVEAAGVACTIAMRRVPHSVDQEMVCAWHLTELRAGEAKAARYRDGRER